MFHCAALSLAMLVPAGSALAQSSANYAFSSVNDGSLTDMSSGTIQLVAAGADDAVMLDMNGFVAETNATHLFAITRGVVRTPRTVACPEGITRATVLELCRSHGIPHEVTDLSLAEFYRADEVFCTGTMGELAAVTRIDGRQIGTGEVGPMTRRLSEIFRALTEHEGATVVDAPREAA